MKNADRAKKIKRIFEQIEFCKKCLETLIQDINADNVEQDNDPYDNWAYIRNHSRHVNDVIYIRRQLMKLEKMLKEG